MNPFEAIPAGYAPPARVLSVFRRVDPETLNNPPAWFNGKLCKLLFASPRGGYQARLWALCFGVATDGQTLLGTLTESPRLDIGVERIGLRMGDPVRFMRGEILDVREMPTS